MKLVHAMLESSVESHGVGLVMSVLADLVRVHALHTESAKHGMFLTMR